jgi:DNA/RNA-binding domain of Phe-tRNA-synthetase-like protein
MNEEVDLAPAAGFVEPQLTDEFPGLRLDWVSVALTPRRDSPRPIRQRLQTLSNRYRGANVVAMRTQPVPHAYRSFFHQIGLDPDVTRIPIEEAAVARLLGGRFPSRGVVEDALLIALIETGVPVWALDAGLVDAGGLGIRTSVTGDRLGSGEDAVPLPPGRLVVADAELVHGVLFGDLARGHAADRRSTRAVLFSVGVEGVPAIHVEETLWVAVEVLAWSE